MAPPRKPRPPSRPVGGAEPPSDSHRGAQRAGILAASDHEALAEALLIVAPEGVADGTLAPLADALAELAALDAAGEAALDGRGETGELLALAGEAKPWPEALRSRRFAELPPIEPVIRLGSGGAAFAALHAATHARTGPEAAAAASRALLTAFLARAEPLARIVLGARALAAQSIAPAAFQQLLDDNLALLAKPAEPERLVEGLREARTVVPRPFGPSPGDKLQPWLDWVRKSPFSAFLLPENQAALHCVFGLGRLYTPPNLPSQTPGPAAISPGVLCAAGALGASVKLTLRGQFGPQAARGGVWGLSVSFQPARIDRWTDTEIEITTDALRRGCNPVQWSFGTDQDLTGSGADAACSEWLRRPLLSQQRVVEIELLRQTARWVDPGSVSVLGPEIALFDTPPPPAAGFIPCEPVTLSWRLAALPCPQDQAAVSVRLLRDGIEIARGLPFAGSRPIADPATTGYTLEVISTLPGGTVCGPPATATRRVLRAPAALTLTLPPDVLAGVPAQGSVSIPCDAPAGGLVVALAADSARLGLPAQVTIPAGQRSARFPITAGDRCGEARIEASAAGQLPAAGTLCVIRAVAIAPNQAPRVTGCGGASVTLRLTCPGRLARLDAALVAPDGARTRLTLRPVGTAPQGCVADTLVALALPALEPGAYRIEIGNGVGTPDQVALTVDPPQPAIVGAPSEISEFIGFGSCPPPEQTVRIVATGNTAIRAVFENPDGNRTVTIARTGTALCPRQTAEVSLVFDRVGTLVVTPERGSVVGPSVRIPVRLSFGTGVFRSAAFFAADPAGQSIGRAVTMTREEMGPAMPSPTSDGTISQGQTRTLALSRCVPTTFVGRRPEVDDPNSKMGGKIPALVVTRGPYLGHPDAPAMAPAENI